MHFFTYLVKEFRSSIYAIEPTKSNYIKRFSLNSLNNLSQLDLILAAIFLILICVLAISITACVLFRQSEKSVKQHQKGIFEFFSRFVFFKFCLKIKVILTIGVFSLQQPQQHFYLLHLLRNQLRWILFLKKINCKQFLKKQKKNG